MFKINFPLKQTPRFKFSILIVVFISICLFANNEVKGDDTKRVLVIDSYHPTLSWVKEIIEGIESTLGAHAEKIDFDIEYMDALRIHNKEYFEKLWEIYIHKINYNRRHGRIYDLIIAIDDEALMMLLKHRREIADHPIVFCGINLFYNLIDSLIKGDNLITGVLESRNYEDTIETALKLHKSAKQVVIIYNEKHMMFEQNKKILKDLFSKHYSRITVVDFLLSEISTGQPLKSIENMGDESIVFLPFGVVDKGGKIYESTVEGLRVLRQKCKAPIYVISKHWVSTNLATGGLITSGFHQGQIAAQMAIRIMDGQKAAHIPIVRKSPNKFMFDHSRLEQFKISPFDLPKDSIILNEPHSFYYKYRTQIYTISGIIAALTTMVILLSIKTLKLRLTERRLRQLAMVVKQAYEGIALADLNGILQFVNNAWAKMHGYESVNTLIGKHFSIFHTEQQMKTEVIPFNEQVKQFGYYTGEIWHKRKNDTIFPTEMITTIFKDEKDKPAGFINLVTDITGRKHAEQQLQKVHDELELRVHQRTAELAQANQQLKSEIIERKRAEENRAKERNLLRTLIDNIPDYIYIKDAQSRFILNNKAHRRSLGVTSQDELTGKTDLDVFPEQLATGYYADEREIIRSGKALINKEEMGKDAQGKEQWLLATKVPLRDSTGKITTLVGISRDITEQKQATDALEKNREQLTATLESTADGILTVDEKQKILHFNSQFTKMWRIPQNIIETKDDKKLLDYVLDQLTEPQTFLSKVYQLYASYEDSFDTLFFKDGRVFERFSRPLIQDEQLVGRVWSFRNITKRKQAEKKILEYQKDLQSLASELSLAEERLRHQIAVNVHDNIGQNLAISKIKMESLAGLLSSPEYTKIIKEALELTNQAIEHTRSLSFELSPPVLYELGFEAAIKWLIRRTAKRDGLLIEFENDGQAIPLADNVRVLLFQAVRELLVNVVKHARAKNVKIAVRKADKQIYVTVEDDGKGFNVSKIKSRGYKTCGFGLFSIQERLKYIGGHIDIDSAPKKGARITLTAPIDTKKNKEKGK